MEMLSALGSHPTLRKLHVVRQAGTAMVNAIGCLLRSTETLQYRELSFKLDKELLRVILQALRANQTVSSLKLGDMACFDEDAANDFVYFIRHECNRNGNVLRKLEIELPNPDMFGRVRNTGNGVDTSLEKVVAGMLQGSALEALHFQKRVSFLSEADRLNVAHLCLGLMEPRVTLSSLQLATLDGAGVKGLVSFLSVATSIRHLTIANLVQMNDVRSVMSGCRRNGSLHSISISRVNDETTESDAAWASTHAWFVHLTAAICNRNKELPFFFSDHASFDDGASDTETTIPEVGLFPVLIRVAQQTPRMGPNGVFAGLLAGIDLCTSTTVCLIEQLGHRNPYGCHLCRLKFADAYSYHVQLQSSNYARFQEGYHTS
jgi:hypothetical protein